MRAQKEARDRTVRGKLTNQWDHVRSSLAKARA